MDKTEQDRIKRQLNYYLAKNIDSLKSKFYCEDGIWSKYQKFIDRFKFDKNENKLCIKTNIENDWKELDLDTYCLGKGDKNPDHNDNGYGTFSWWVEFYLKDLGAVGGSSSAVHGIYYSPKSKCYRNGTNNGISQEIGNEQTEKISSNNNAQSYFTEGTYRFIKGELGIDKDSVAIESCYSNCKPNAVVLNKIYYLFNMEKSDTKLIPIFKEDSLDNVVKQIVLDESTQLNNWESKSQAIFEQFVTFLDSKQNKITELESIPTASGADNNKVEYVTINEGLKSTAINLFKSYCFGCFFWSTFENQGGLSNKIDELISRGDKNIILTGAPGTGKTFACQSYAREQVSNFIYENNLEKAEGKQSAYLTVDYFIKTVQFHPGYDYSDFIEGLRPKKVDSNII